MKKKNEIIWGHNETCYDHLPLDEAPAYMKNMYDKEGKEVTLCIWDWDATEKEISSFESQNGLLKEKPIF